MENKFLPYGRQWINKEDIKAVADTLKSDFITTGPKAKEFEEAIAKYCNVKYAVAVSSGSAALYMATKAIDISTNDRLITSPITFLSSSNCSFFNGGQTDFVDIYSDTYNINDTRIKNKINPKTKVIVPVDFAGQPCKLDEINKIAKENNLHVIEDAAHSLGAEYKGKKVGGLSEITIFSFHPVKSITTGEGGMVLTNNKEIYERLQMLRNHGITKDVNRMNRNHGDWYYEMQKLSCNFKLTDFQCALGLSQLKRLDGFIKRRQEITKIYNEEFKEVPEITIPYTKPDVKSACHLYVIQVKNRKKVFDRLRKENMFVQVHYIPVYKQLFYQKKGYGYNECPIAEEYYKHCISIPLFPKMTDEDIKQSISIVKKAVKC